MMSSKILFLTLAMLLIVPSVNAAIEWNWSMNKLNQSSFFELDQYNSTCLPNFKENRTEVAFLATCEYLGKPAISSPWTTNLNPNVTNAFPFDEYNVSIQVRKGQGGESKVVCSEAEGVIDGYMISNIFNGGGGTTEYHQGDDATFGATVGIVGTEAVFNYDGAADSQIDISNDKTRWVWFRIDSSAGVRKHYIYNFSNFDEATFPAGTITVHNIRTSNTGSDGVFNRIRSWDELAGRNASANRCQFNPLPLTTSATSFRINITTNNSANINVSFSCDGSDYGAGGGINTTISCGAGSATNRPRLRIDFNESSGIFYTINGVEPIAGAPPPPPAGAPLSKLIRDILSVNSNFNNKIIVGVE